MQNASSTHGGIGPDPAIQTARVRDVMRRDFISISGSESLLEALELMRLARLRHLTIETDGVLVGILSYRDLQDALLALRGAEAERDARAQRDARAVDHLSGTPFSIAPDATLAEAAARLDRLRVGCLPVVEGTERGPRLMGLLTESDLLRVAFSRS